MGLTFLTGYVLGQHGAQSARLASTAASQSNGSVEEILDLHERVDRLVTVVDAMWSLLEDSGFTDEQLIERIREIDEADGVIDGKRTAVAADCIGCGAKVAPGLSACQFCGTQLPETSNHPLGGI